MHNSFRHIPDAAIYALVVLLVMGVLDAPLAGWTGPHWLDAPVTGWLIGNLPGLPFVILGVTAITVLFLTATCVLPHGPRLARVRVSAQLLLIALAVPLILCLVLKHSLGRARPYMREWTGHLHFEPFAFQDALASLPSAQAAMAAGLVAGVALLSPRHVRLAWVIGLAICLCRWLSGEHWLSDVIAGWAVGMLSATAAVKALRPDTHRHGEAS